MSPAPLSHLSRVEAALHRLNLLNKSCDYIRTHTGLEPLHIDHPSFSLWVQKLESLPIKSTKTPKRKLSHTKKSKAIQAHIYYNACKASKLRKGIYPNAPPSPP